MGVDKGQLEFGGVPAVRRGYDRLQRLVGSAFVSARPEQLERPPYLGFAAIPDRGGDAGPAVGLLSAWEARPGVAWLVLAVDMPYVDDALLQALIDARRPDCHATLFVQADNRPEPLCTIFEPVCQQELAACVAEGRASLRDFLAGVVTHALRPRSTKSLKSVNEPRAYEVAVDSLSSEPEI